MNNSTIICPTCKTEIPLTDAMAHRVREQMEKEFAVLQQKLRESITARENDIAAKAKAVEAAQKSIELQVAERLATERKGLQAERGHSIGV